MKISGQINHVQYVLDYELSNGSMTLTVQGYKVKFMVLLR